MASHESFQAAAGSRHCAGSSPFAPASGLTASATVIGTLTGSTSSLSTSATPSFSKNLDLGDQTQTYPVPMTAQDTRGRARGGI